MPSSQSVEVTHTATFTTMVTGVGSDDFTYQWRHNGTVISGEANNALIITNVMENNTGMYNCTVMNQYGDINSSVALLVVTGMYYAYTINPLTSFLALRFCAPKSHKPKKLLHNACPKKNFPGQEVLAQ